MSEKQFSGKSAIVTGATRGIGRAIALELAKRGANVAFNFARSQEEADKLKTEIETLGVKAFAQQCDVANTEASAEFVKQAWAELGAVNFLVNNAGITRDTLILRMKEDDWDAVIDTNLKGAWNFSKAVMRPMMKNDANGGGGAIINVTSISGVVGMMGQTNYSASKAGMIGLTKALAKEIASRKITVNAVALGLIETDMSGQLETEYQNKLLEMIPLKRLGNTQEVAEIVCFLLSDSARYITGQVIQADGGLAM
jgi:3-oxoacyl-[acyl-carrier protein] reductase